MPAKLESPNWLDDALWLEQAYSCCADIIDIMFYPRKQVSMSYKEFKLKFSIKSVEETCLYDWNNLEIILVQSLGLDQKEINWFFDYLKSETHASAN